MTRTEEMQQLAVQEATNLKKHATSQEIGNLNIHTFGGSWVNSCIYGQMTGSCISDRANTLIMKCATKVYETNGFHGSDKFVLNGEPYPVNQREYGMRINKYYSPIEMIVLNEYSTTGSEAPTAAKIMDFLKDKTQELIF